MRILHIIQRYWPAKGGAEVYLGEVSRRLATEGHSVTVLTTDAGDFELFWDPHRRRIAEYEEWHEGVHIVRFPVRHLPFASLTYSAWRRLLWVFSRSQVVPVKFLARLARFTPWVPELWDWLKNTNETFDLVAGMTICFESLLDAGLRFAREQRVPFVIYPLTHLGAGDKPAQDSLSRFYTMRHQIGLANASDAIVAQTVSEKNFYENHDGADTLISVIGAGVTPEKVLGGDGQRFRVRHALRDPIVVCLSTMSYDKGVVHLVEAMRTLWRVGRQIDLVLAGKVLTPFRHYMDTLPDVDRDRIHLLGFVSEAEKRDLLAACDVFAMPSRTDSFGIVYLEAWLYKKPVIGAQTWGICDVITDGQDGLLVPFGDVASLADAITYLLENPIERRRMGLRGEEKVYQSHTWEHKYALIRDLYHQLVADT